MLEQLLGQHKVRNDGARVVKRVDQLQGNPGRQACYLGLCNCGLCRAAYSMDGDLGAAPQCHLWRLDDALACGAVAQLDQSRADLHVDRAATQ